MRTKIEYRSVSRATYDEFCKRHPEVEIPYREWAEIIYSFNEEFRNLILETGDKYKLPLGLGSFSINKKKRKIKKLDPTGVERMNLPVDWKKSQEKGKIIYNFNYHTEGYFFGWLWFKDEARFRHSYLYMFKPSRVTSRMLGHYIMFDKKYQHLYRYWNL